MPVQTRLLKRLRSAAACAAGLVKKKQQTKWLSGKVPGKWKKGNITLMFKEREKGRPRELQASKRHVCA